MFSERLALDLTERIRGRLGMKLRQQRLANELFCRMCGRLGQTPDHILPLSKGGTDTDDNIQVLCKVCHDKKTRQDFGWKPPKPRTGLDGWAVED